VLPATAIEAAIDGDIRSCLDAKRWKQRDTEIAYARKLLSNNARPPAFPRICGKYAHGHSSPENSVCPPLCEPPSLSEVTS
jgi:hypothetical protein